MKKGKDSKVNYNIFVIGSDAVINIKDLIRIILDNHFYMFGWDMTAKQKIEELAFLKDLCKQIGINIINIKATKDEQIEIILRINNKIERIYWC